MAYKSRVMVIGVAVSLVLLFLFGYMQQVGAKFLDLSEQWIFLAILPVVVALFVGGYITRFKGFGVELETALKEPVATSVDLTATDAISDIPGDEKQSYSYLQQLPEGKALAARWLVFDMSRKNYYWVDTILQYLVKMKNIDFLEVRTGTGDFVCYVPKSHFVRDGALDEFERYDRDKVKAFVDAINEGNIREKYAGIAVFLTVKSTDSLVQVLRIMRDENVSMAGVVSDKGNYLG
ncbi:MAG TPA: hypothetical protein VJ965_11425, partial [Anaerolineales bacterium]|nr:hypothetical protein [Anaerolineales bacterium]